MLAMLNDNQKVVLDAYIERYVEEPLNDFINAINLPSGKEKRAALILTATQVGPEIFLPLLNCFYPMPTESYKHTEQQLKLQTQRKFFHDLLKDINLFCQATPDALRHPIFTQTFAANITFVEYSVEDKINLVAEYMKMKIKNLLIAKHFDLDKPAHPEVINAIKAKLHEITQDTPSVHSGKQRFNLG